MIRPSSPLTMLLSRHTRRREFITLIGGAAAWPLAAHAQQAMPVIGILSISQPHVFADMIDAFRKGLSEMGLVEGRNVTFEHRAAGNDYDRFRAMADDLVRRDVAVIFSTGGAAAALAAKAATVTIPIVFYMGSDPVQQGLVASLSRPGGNLTGFSMLSVELVPKRLELLRELVPSADVIAVLENPTNPYHEFETRDAQQAARTLGRQLLVFGAGSEAQLDGVFATIKQRARALIVASDGFFSARRGQITALAARHALPTIYDRRDFPATGGLISYGHHRADAYRQLGIYAGRILKGENPSDLPVLQPTKFELVINMRTAKALSLTVPPTMLALADEVIE